MARAKAPTAKVDIRSQALTEGPLKLLYVPVKLAMRMRWDSNYKIWDLPKVKESIRTYGFRDPALFDDALNDGEGGIPAGNGRTQAMHEMQEAGEPLPDYCREQDGDWYFPLIFGAESKTLEMAEAFALDHNNIGIGVLPAEEAKKIWEPQGYLEVLQRLNDRNQLPVSVRPDQVRKWIKESAPEEPEEDEQETVDPEKIAEKLRNQKPALTRIVLYARDIPSFEEAIAATGKQHDRAEALAEILNHYLTVHG